MAKEKLHEQLNEQLISKIQKEIKELETPGHKKRLKYPSSPSLRKFLDEEIERNENLLNKMNSLPIENREIFNREIQRRIDCFKQLDQIVQAWSTTTKPADQ